MFEMMLIGLPENRLDGSILPALARLVDSGTVRVLDMVLVSKDIDGNVQAVEVDSLGSLDGFGGVGGLGVPGGIGGVFSEEDLELAGEQLVRESAAALVLWENSWAAKLSAEIFDAGGAVLLHDHVPAEVVAEAWAPQPAG